MSFWFFLAALGSEVVGTIAGFGSSTLFLPLALWFVDVRTALTLVAFLHVFGNLGRISFFHRGFDRSIALRFGIPSVAATLAGALLVPSVPQSTLKGLVGVFLVAYALFSLWNGGFRLKPTLVNAILGGGTSGFLAGLIGTGGALRSLFLTGFGLPKVQYIATAAAIALAVDVTRIPVYLVQGFLEPQLYWSIPILFAVAIAGSMLGKRVVDVIPQRQFKKVVLIALLLIGFKFTFDWM